MLWPIFLLIFLFWGVLVWKFFFPKEPLSETLLIGGLVGVTLSTSLPALLAIILDFPDAAAASLILAALGSGAMLWLVRPALKVPSLALIKENIRKYRGLIAGFLIVSVVFLPLIPKILFVNDADWYATGFRAAYGDVPFHLMYTTSFAWGENFPVENPDFAGTPSNYPFLPYTVSAALTTLGADLRTAFLAPAMLLGMLIVALLIYVPWRLTGSAFAAFLTALLFVFSGGLGAIWFFETHGLDIFSRAQFLGSGVIDETTNIPSRHIALMNTLLSSLLPQRGILFGLPIFLAVTFLWWKQSSRAILLSAFLASALPWLHAHTFVVILLTAPLTVLTYALPHRPGDAGAQSGGADDQREDAAKKAKQGFTRYKPWFWFGVIVFIAAALQFVALKPASEHSYLKSLRFSAGWMLGGENFVWFWIKNTGLLLPLLLFALASPLVPKLLKRWYFTMLPLFFFGNFLVFTPWEFDNHKLLHLWYLASLVPVAAFLAALFRKPSIGMKTLAVCLIAGLALSGAIDVARLWYFSSLGFPFMSPEGRTVADFIKTNTPPTAVFLASTKYNSPIVITGRKRFLGYGGWLWAHGIDAEPRRQDSALMFRGHPTAERLLKERGITHILIGPEERAEFEVTEGFFKACCRLLHDANGYQVFVRHAADKP